MKKLFLITGLMFALVSLAEATEITKTSATGTTFKFTATLNAPLTTGNKVKIDFGKGGLKAMTCSAKTCTLSSNVLPTGISTATYKIGIYDAKNVLQGSTSDGTYVISSTSNAVISTTGYTKIANNGSTLSDDAKLGSEPTDWACTKDNKTGLIWEVKTTDGGLRDWTKTYTNYTPDYDPTNLYNAKTNANGFVTAVNTQSLCGASNWRVPSIDELKGLLTTTSTVNQPLDQKIYIHANYFPNTNNWFWSSSPLAYDSHYAWIVYFYSGSSDYDFKGSIYNVRLVR